MALDLHSIPIIDDHCHPPHRRQPETEEELKAYFTESRDTRIVSDHVQHTLFYRQSLRDLASLLDCPEAAEAVIARRSDLPLKDYLSLIVRQANIQGLVMDFGYLPEQSYRPEEVKSLLEGTSCQTWYVLRLETLIERLIGENQSFAGFLGAYASELRDLREKGVAALKSIIAYRAGLDIQRASSRQAADAFDRVKEESERSHGSLRIASKPLLDFLTVMALEEAARQSIPVQFHTALGDTDLDLLEANPLRLRPILEDPAFQDVPIVLLHCYPYLREAAYLSNMYGNVYVDLSMTLPLLNHTSTRALEDVLGMAPASKVLYGSDAPGIPDFLWLGAVAWRRALDRLLTDWVEHDGMPESQAQLIARRIFYENSRTLYSVKP